jgi:hypothetical protein
MAEIKVPIAKAGKSGFVTVETDNITDQSAYEAIFIEGLKVVLNARMSKVGSITKLEGEELAKAQAKALEIAAENLVNLYAGKLKASRTKSAAESEVPREVMTEALRAARDLVKNEIRKNGGKPSVYTAAQITQYARSIIASDPTILVTAAAAIEARKSIATAPIDIAGLAPSPKLIAKAAESAAKRKAEKAATGKPLSAKQASKVAPRRKASPTAEATASIN